MAITYNPLWKWLIDRGLGKTDMMNRAKISANMFEFISKDKIGGKDL